MVQLSLTQRVLLTAGSAVGALVNPLRGDLVATLGETTGTMALEVMHQRMKQSTAGLQILKDKPRVTPETMDMEYLRSLPANAFGYHYYTFMSANHLSAQRASTKFVEDPELSYVMTRYRENHDFLHTLTGAGVTVAEEVALKWFELTQTGLPMCALSAVFGPLQLTKTERRHLLSEQIPWAVACGRAATFYMNIHFEEMLERDIGEVRRMMKISVMPGGSLTPLG